MKPLLMPAIFLLLVAALLHTGIFLPSAPLAVSAFSGACMAGLLLSWRFHSSRIFSALLVLYLAQQAISYFCSAPFAARSASLALSSIGILLPLNFVLLSFSRERGFSLSNLASTGTVLFLQAVLVLILCRPEPFPGAHRVAHSPQVPLPFAVEICFAAAAIILLIRYALFRQPAESGLLCALAACFLALDFGGSGRIPTSYFSAAALILAGAVVETSYLLAYHDELTALPSRRAFNDALLRLTPPYSIAVADIDHFKRCNDTHGHETGDQVLQLVASRLARVSGGGQAYRCGGEEFVILFPGKTVTDVLEPLEHLRRNIEGSKLRVRGPDRRRQTRGPDRRNRWMRGRFQTGHANRQLWERPPASEISVTVSIGVATSTTEKQPVREVIHSADKALYRAKSAGRNRIETASSARRRSRSKTAGIA
jgi:diguanylate cyclase (GGDEF)-like protein